MIFTKMHGLGNDYIFVDGFKQNIEGYNLAELARLLSDRHFGVGGDGLVLILPSEAADFQMRIFNADGSEAEMCGNAIRCFAKYVFERGLTTKTNLAVETGAGIIRPRIELEDGQVRSVCVDMGEPRLKRGEIPIQGPAEETALQVLIPLEEGTYTATCVSMGNPHCVIFVEEITDKMVLEHGPLIENHKLFPRRTNVEFVEILNPQELSMRVWERGAGETLACGTGASAATVAAVLNGYSERLVTVHLRGGDLRIEWNEADNHVYMTGPATEVFSGEVHPAIVEAALLRA